MKLSPGQTIAVVGLSAQPDRPSFDVAHAMQQAGFRIIPVNPRYAGSKILGETCVTHLADITVTVDIVNCFRKSEEILNLTHEVLRMSPLPKTLWMQLGVSNPEARMIAESQGITVVENQCIKIEYFRSASSS